MQKNNSPIVELVPTVILFVASFLFLQLSTSAINDTIVGNARIWFGISVVFFTLGFVWNISRMRTYHISWTKIGTSLLGMFLFVTFVMVPLGILEIVSLLHLPLLWLIGILLIQYRLKSQQYDDIQNLFS